MLVDNYIPVAGGSYSGGIIDQINDRNFAALRRPYLDRNGRPAVTVNVGRYTRQDSRGGEPKPLLEHVLIGNLQDYGLVSPVANATSLRKEEWLELDRVVLRAARFRMRAWSDLAAANSFGGFNGMSKMILEHETMSDPGEAIVDMDGLTEGRTDAPKFQLEGLPLPITHSDFWFSSRRLAISRNSGTPLDTTMGESAGRRVAETIEKTTIGIQTGPTYGGNSTQVGGYGRTSSVYGYTNFSSKLTVTGFRKPTSTAVTWVPAMTLADVLKMRDALYLNKFYGPFMLYHSNDWDQYMDNDYILTGGNVATQTLRERLKSIDGISDVKRLDFLFAAAIAASTGPGGENLATTYPFTILMVQMTPDVCRAVNGMDITTVQWEAIGGMRLNFKILTISVPQLRADFYGNCGIALATASV